MSFAHRLLIRAITHFRSGLYAGLLLCAMSVAHAAALDTFTVNTLSDASGGDCSSSCSLRDAMAHIAPGGTITFAQALLPGTIVLNSPLQPVVSMTIQGPGAGQLAISGSGGYRVLLMNSSSSTVNIVGVTIEEGVAVGANGDSGVSGTGAHGKAGEGVGGGCIYLGAGSLILDEVNIFDCFAIGGSGGNGGTGTAGTGLGAGGPGGDGSSGGDAEGGGISASGLGAENLTLRNSSLSNTISVGGFGGKGGDGGSGALHGAGGNGGLGGGALGGAIFFAGENLSIYNTTIAGSATQGNIGGNGGAGDSFVAGAPGGHGGDGGSGPGGLVYVLDPMDARLEFSTLANGAVVAGAGGKGGAGKVSGAAGQPGVGLGTAIFTLNGSALSVLSTIIVGTGTTPLCDANPAISASGANLAEDSSCGASLQGDLARLFRPLDPDPSLPIAYVPRYGSAVIDAATTCNDLTAQPVTADQRGTPRPQGSACDIGAIEADYIFIDGFE